MATPINTPLTGEIRHLSIDDLFAPLPGARRLGGSGPFVINLSASTVPISLPKAGIAGSHRALVYHIQRVEDRRLRYRLRLGPFANEDDADVTLQKVRDIYPGALTATAEADDLRAIAILEAKAESSKALVGKPIERPAEKQPEEPAEKLAAATGPCALTPPISLVVTESAPSIGVSAAASAPSIAAILVPPTLPASTQVFRVRAPTSSPSPAPVPAPQASPAISKPVGTGSRPPQALAAARPVESISTPVLSLETTQTVRVLTSSELRDAEALRWFVIQLSLAEHPFDPETVPDLDIFSVYRLYSVANIDQGQIMHALRVGFFGEEVAALAVASYLASYYDKPIIKRVSVAERERFANHRLEPRKDVGATGMHAAIEITDERFIREKRSMGSAAVPNAPTAMFTQQTAAAKK